MSRNAPYQWICLRALNSTRPGSRPLSMTSSPLESSESHPPPETHHSSSDNDNTHTTLNESAAIDSSIPADLTSTLHKADDNALLILQSSLKSLSEAMRVSISHSTQLASQGREVAYDKAYKTPDKEGNTAIASGIKLRNPYTWTSKYWRRQAHDMAKLDLTHTATTTRLASTIQDLQHIEYPLPSTSQSAKFRAAAQTLSPSQKEQQLKSTAMREEAVGKQLNLNIEKLHDFVRDVKSNNKGESDRRRMRRRMGEQRGRISAESTSLASSEARQMGAASSVIHISALAPMEEYNPFRPESSVGGGGGVKPTETVAIEQQQQQQQPQGKEVELAPEATAAATAIPFTPFINREKDGKLEGWGAGPTNISEHVKSVLNPFSDWSPKKTIPGPSNQKDKPTVKHFTPLQAHRLHVSREGGEGSDGKGSKSKEVTTSPPWSSFPGKKAKTQQLNGGNSNSNSNSDINSSSISSSSSSSSSSDGNTTDTETKLPTGLEQLQKKLEAKTKIKD